MSNLKIFNVYVDHNNSNQGIINSCLMPKQADVIFTSYVPEINNFSIHCVTRTGDEAQLQYSRSFQFFTCQSDQYFMNREITYGYEYFSSAEFVIQTLNSAYNLGGIIPPPPPPMQVRDGWVYPPAPSSTFLPTIQTTRKVIHVFRKLSDYVDL